MEIVRDGSGYPLRSKIIDPNMVQDSRVSIYQKTNFGWGSENFSFMCTLGTYFMLHSIILGKDQSKARSSDMVINAWFSKVQSN